MRKPAHAKGDTTVMAVTVFDKGSKHASFEASGADPSNIAMTVSNHPRIANEEKPYIRRKVRDALKALQDKTIPNVTSISLDIGGRRVRIKEVH